MLAIAAILFSSAPLLSSAAFASAPSYKSFKCTVKSANVCVVTIKLTSKMKEQVGSTMPDSHPWYLQHTGGTTSKGGYTLSGTYWDGKSGGKQGTVWSALLKTGTVSSGDTSSLTFAHVSSAPRHYRAFEYSYTSKAFTGASVSITTTVTPNPPKGHLLVQVLSSKKWVNVVGCTYATKAKEWACSFKWSYPKHTSRRYRLLALAAPGLLTTPSPSFVISTAS
jgi:hypothetical protein